MQTEAKPLMESLDYAVTKKVDLVEKSWVRYAARGMVAATCLGLGTNATFLLYNKLHHVDATGSIGKIAAAVFFGFCLIMIVFMNGELFTSNAMYFSAGLFRKKVTWKNALKVLLICYLANLVGGVLFSWVFVQGGVWDGIIKEEGPQALYNFIGYKIAKTPYQIFMQGIIANLVVNISVIVALRAKEDSAKMTALIGIIFIFAFFGHEHVIANFASFSTVFFATHGYGFELMPVLTNLFFATLGNIVGGGLLVGVVYAWLNSGDSKYVD